MDKLAEVTVGPYYAYKALTKSLNKPFWFDQSGIVVDHNYCMLLEELAVCSISQPKLPNEIDYKVKKTVKTTAIIFALWSVVIGIFETDNWKVRLTVAYWLIMLTGWEWIRERFDFRLPWRRKAGDNQRAS